MIDWILVFPDRKERNCCSEELPRAGDEFYYNQDAYRVELRQWVFKGESLKVYVMLKDY